ncbi:MAG: M14 family zinc carboxypeptidase [bacterium]
MCPHYAEPTQALPLQDRPPEDLRGATGADSLPTPVAAFGFVPGTDKKLADYHQIVAYFKSLDVASDRVELQNLGKTTEDNDFYVAIISSPENLARIEEWKNLQARLADPRTLAADESEALLRSGRTIVLINCALHSTEVGATQMAPELAYFLAASQDDEAREILDNVITLLVPSHNPDGQLLVVNWYRQHVDTPFEKAPLPRLYQKYAGHDNNRDWFMFTQKETRLTVEKLYNVWRPHITVDMHQMGRTGARLFVPPYVDPYEPNVDPMIVSLLSMLGTHVQAELTMQGKLGVASNAIFDAWTPARSYPHYHGGLRFLTEAASAEYASPVNIPEKDLRGGIGYDARAPSWNFPRPWPGGAWTLQDIVAYDFAAAKAVLAHAARQREFWLRSLHQAQCRAVAAPKKPAAFVIPARQRDSQALLDLLSVLQLGMVEIHRAPNLPADNGHAMQISDYVVRLDQPYGSFAKALLEKQAYPRVLGNDGRPRIPYDVTAHTLPLYLGVEVLAVDEPPQVALDLVDEISAPATIVGAPRQNFFALSRSNTASFRAVNALLRKGVRIWCAQEKFFGADSSWPAGTFVIAGGKQANLIAEMLHRQELTRSVHGNPGTIALYGFHEAPGVPLQRVRAPRIGIYQSWTANIDAGWTRWVLEEYGFEYHAVTNDRFQSESLRNSCDVIIFPDQNANAIVNGYAPSEMPAPYAGGIGESGVRNLRRFVEKGGTLIALNAACELAIKYLPLQLEDVTPSLPRQQFSAPGSILRVQAEVSHPLAWGARTEEAIFFLESPVFRWPAGAAFKGRAILSYPAEELLLSGWLEGGKELAGHAALVETPYGKGRVILFGCRPQFRAQFRNGYKFLFNAVHLAAAS